MVLQEDEDEQEKKKKKKKKKKKRKKKKSITRRWRSALVDLKKRARDYDLLARLFFINRAGLLARRCLFADVGPSKK
jgi:hypothetical protein